MGQEFIIKSQQIEDKINQLLPSQGGFQAGVDFSASTTVIPIVDLTETAEGSTLRQDLQTSLSLTSITSTQISGTTSTIVNTTGYYRLYGTIYISSRNSPSTNSTASLDITDGISSKRLVYVQEDSISNQLANQILPIDLNVFLEAGDSVTGTTSDTQSVITIASRQIADLSGNLINP